MKILNNRNISFFSKYLIIGNNRMFSRNVNTAKEITASYDLLSQTEKLTRQLSPGSYTLRYLSTYKKIMPTELLKFITLDPLFLKKIDTVLNTPFHPTSTLVEIRELYISNEIQVLINTCIDQYHQERDNSILSHYQIRDLARLTNKWIARGKMLDLGFKKEVEKIHLDNLKHYGNSIGPTPEYLDSKYKTYDEREEACARFRNLKL